jgi:hypothetical protein
VGGIQRRRVKDKQAIFAAAQIETNHDRHVPVEQHALAGGHAELFELVRVLDWVLDELLEVALMFAKSRGREKGERKELRG